MLEKHVRKQHIVKISQKLQLKMLSLEVFLQVCNYLYRCTGYTHISDSAYDALIKELEALEIVHPEFKSFGGAYGITQMIGYNPHPAIKRQLETMGELYKLSGEKNKPITPENHLGWFMVDDTENNMLYKQAVVKIATEEV